MGPDKNIVPKARTSFFSRRKLSKKNLQREIIFESAPSPYYTNKTIEPLFIVLHCTGYEDPLKVLMDNKVSCHYLIPQQKKTEQLLVYEVVKPPLRAWHAGISHWQNYTGLNDYAIGIEISMPNYAYALENKTLDFFYFEEYQALQIEALKILVKQLQKQYNIPPENVVGHSDIAPWRTITCNVVLGKTDPGPTLPWEKLAEEGIGIWPSNDCPDDIKENLTAEQAQKLLQQVGYNVNISRIFDKETQFAIGAARTHWLPTCFNTSSGLADNCYKRPFDTELACTLYNLRPNLKFMNDHLCHHLI